MLTLSPATRDDGRSGGCDGSAVFCGFTDEQEFPEFADHGDLLDIIDFDDLFDVAGDLLPDLEIEPAGDLSPSSTITTTTTGSQGETTNKGILGRSEEVVSKRAVETYEGESDQKKKSCSKNNREGKRKVKVDWTAELHRRFVEAVEQLGVDKAVPSRILELMGVHCLTRHNVASHLQKYRSHRKHLQAREAEAANWTRKRHIYGVDRNKNGWLAPSIGFPSQPPPPPVHHHLNNHHFRPLHVWGHPTVDQSVMWPKPSTPVPFWVSDSPYWQRVHNGTTPYFPTGATRFRGLAVAGIPQAHNSGYKVDHRPPPADLHPSKESVDAAIGEVLTRPWQPLPLGLKPPAVDSVMTELHRHGVSKVPPTASSA